MKLSKLVSLTNSCNYKGIRKTTRWQDRILKKFVSENYKGKTKDLVMMLSNAGGPMMSRTVRTRLSGFDFKACFPLEKPELSPAMRKKNLAWAHEYKSWTEGD
jgi:hypothetical protein